MAVDNCLHREIEMAAEDGGSDKGHERVLIAVRRHFKAVQFLPGITGALTFRPRPRLDRLRNTAASTMVLPIRFSPQGFACMLARDRA